MFDLFLNAAKFVVSEDARKSASAIVELVRRSPEWQQDICTLEAKIRRAHAEHALLLGELTVSKMHNLNYDEEAITAFRAVYLELIRNAFEHGCKAADDIVKIALEITQAYVGLKIINPKRRKFNLYKILEQNRNALESNPRLLRGRGLLLAGELSDTIDAIEDNTGIKAVICSTRVSFNIKTFDGLTILRVKSGLHNPSFSRRISSLASKYSQYNLLLDLSEFDTVPTEAATETIRVNLNFEKTRNNQKMIVLLSGNVGIHFPPEIVAYSWKDALTKLDMTNLLDQLPPPYRDPEPMYILNEDEYEDAQKLLDLPTPKYCPIHGPYDADLETCPYCSSKTLEP